MCGVLGETMDSYDSGHGFLIDIMRYVVSIMLHYRLPITTCQYFFVVTRLEQRDSQAGNAFTTASKTQPVGGGCFHADAGDGNVQVRGEMLAHRRDMRGQTWVLEDDRSVNVAHLPAMFCQQVDRIGEEDGTRGVLPAWIAGGEMLADIPQCRCAQQGINNCMDQHIGIRMACQTWRVGYLYPAQDEAAVVRELVDIKPDAYMHAHRIFLQGSRSPMARLRVQSASAKAKAS